MRAIATFLSLSSAFAHVLKDLKLLFLKLEYERVP